MSTYEELLERKSIRIFSNEEISKEDKFRILNASINAPSAGNQQPYRIIDITDKEIQKKLSVLCDNQPFINEGRMVLVYCTDMLKWLDSFKYTGCAPRDLDVGDLILSMQDTLIAAQNAVTCAWSLNIGSCYIGDILENKEKIQELLHLPKYVVPATLIVFGHIDDRSKNSKKPNRESLDSIVNENYYHLNTKEEIEELFIKKQKLENVEAYDTWIKAFCNRKYNSDFSKEMQRSVGQYIKDYQK